MSHDQGRPSLFAGMEDGAAAEADTQRVRILSTLESTRRVSRPARKGGGRQRTSAQKAPISRVWLAFFGITAIALITSFVTVLRAPEPTHTPPALVAQRPAPLPAATPSVPAATPASEALAVAEPATAASEAASTPFQSLDALPPTAASSSNAPGRDPMAALKAPASPDASVVAAATAATGAAVAAAKTGSKAQSAANNANKPDPNSNAAANAKRTKRKDSEVALIEAVMTHGSSRPRSK